MFTAPAISSLNPFRVPGNSHNTFNHGFRPWLLLLNSFRVRVSAHQQTVITNAGGQGHKAWNISANSKS
jgi:hypothetical protein